jgi:hypothetical protein
VHDSAAFFPLREIAVPEIILFGRMNAAKMVRIALPLHHGLKQNEPQ